MERTILALHRPPLPHQKILTPQSREEWGLQLHPTTISSVCQPLPTTCRDFADKWLEYKKIGRARFGGKVRESTLWAVGSPVPYLHGRGPGRVGGRPPCLGSVEPPSGVRYSSLIASAGHFPIIECNPARSGPPGEELPETAFFSLQGGYPWCCSGLTPVKYKEIHFTARGPIRV